LYFVGHISIDQSAERSLSEIFEKIFYDMKTAKLTKILQMKIVTVEILSILPLSHHKYFVNISEDLLSTLVIGNVAYSHR